MEAYLTTHWYATLAGACVVPAVAVACWRLWRGRKVKQRAMGEARAELTRPRVTFLHIDEAQYVEDFEAIIDTIPTGGMKSIDRPVPYGGSKPDESKRPVTFAEFEELVAMHGRMREREIERERDVDSRLAALEAKEAPDCGPGYWGINTTSAGRSFGNFTASGFAKMSSNNNLEVFGPQDFTATPPASKPEVRVFRRDDQTHWLWTPDGGVWRYGKRSASVFSTSGLTVKDFDSDPDYSELVGSVYNAIVAEWRAWKREI